MYFNSVERVDHYSNIDIEPYDEKMKLIDKSLLH